MGQTGIGVGVIAAFREWQDVIDRTIFRGNCLVTDTAAAFVALEENEEAHVFDESAEHEGSTACAVGSCLLRVGRLPSCDSGFAGSLLLQIRGMVECFAGSSLLGILGAVACAAGSPTDLASAF